MPKFIHLLYVPTMACNMACQYCYLEDKTVDAAVGAEALATLQFAVEKFLAADVLPFNISLHGGEVTVLPPAHFRALIAYIAEHYERHGETLRAAGFKVGSPHIKTNLYALDRHLATLRDYHVSVSGSLDLPFSLHDTHRLSKAGQPTLSRILENVALLAPLDNRKKVSATIFREHYERLDEMIADIWRLHRETCLDMNDFNFMIGFDYQSNGLLHALTEAEMVDFFERMHAAFDGTELDAGVNGAWFKEFGPEYCTNCDNCGEKFFLLERNGDIYSCVRGQKQAAFYYGNIFRETVAEILTTAEAKIFAAHNRLPMAEECLNCDYLYLCKTGCPFVKNLYETNRSYTCRLQLAYYPRQGYAPDPFPAGSRFDYLAKMHPDLLHRYVPKREVKWMKDEQLAAPVVTAQAAEMAEPQVGEAPAATAQAVEASSVEAPAATAQSAEAPAGSAPDLSLPALISADRELQKVYDPTAFIFSLDGVDYPLESQILKTKRDFVYMNDESQVRLYVRQDVLDAACDWPANNALYLMLLSGEMIQYGDEGRTKQRHLMTHQVYKGVLERLPSDRPGYFCLDLGPLLALYAEQMSPTAANNFFVTTTALRELHYAKQRKNAYYHIQAIDLPFPNIELFYLRLNGSASPAVETAATAPQDSSEAPTATEPKDSTKKEADHV